MLEVQFPIRLHGTLLRYRDNFTIPYINYLFKLQSCIILNPKLCHKTASDFNTCLILLYFCIYFISLSEFALCPRHLPPEPRDTGRPTAYLQDISSIKIHFVDVNLTL